MLEQVLTPCVQNGDETDLDTQVVGIGSDGAQGLGAGLEEDIVKDLFVLVGDGCDRLRYGKDDVEIFDPV